MPEPGDAGVPGEIAALSHLVGSGATLATVALVAYLLGTFLTVDHWPGGLRYTKKIRGLSFPLAWMREATEWAALVLVDFDPMTSIYNIEENPRLPAQFMKNINRFAGEMESQKRGSDDEVPRDDFHISPVEPVGPRSDLITAALTLMVPVEADLLSANLRAVNDSLFQDYDRLRSEAELRYTLSIPLAVFVISLGILWHVWAFAGLLFCLALLLYGRRDERRALQRLATALRLGVITSPIAEALLKTEASPIREHDELGNWPGPTRLQVLRAWFRQHLA